MKSAYLYIVLALIAFVLHFAWESAHLPLYTGYGSLGGPLPTALYAALGDVFYTLCAALFVALFKRDGSWMRSARASDYVGLAIVGFFLALFVEYKALALHRWAYTAAMPIVFGVGLSPLAQMTILLPLSVFLSVLLTRAWTRR